MRKIFISYRRDDTRPHALAIYRELDEKLHPDSLFFDLDKIAAGKDFRQVIQESLRETGVMLVLIGPQWLTLTDSTGQRRLDQPGDWVRIEIEQALLHHQSDPTLCNIIPILIDNTPMPQASALPKSIQALAPIQALHVRFDTDFERDMERVLREVQPYISTLGANNSAGPQVLRCPKCGQVDNVKKLTFVKGDLPVPAELSLSVREFYGREPVEPTWNEYEAKRIGRNFRENLQGCYFWCAIIPVVVAVIGFIMYNEPYAALTAWLSLLVLVLFALVIGSLYFSSLRRSRAKYSATFNETYRAYQEALQKYQEQKQEHHATLLIKQKELEDRMQVYERRKPVWDQLFYCQRDGSCFLPGSPKVDQDPIVLIDALLPLLPNQTTR